MLSSVKWIYRDQPQPDCNIPLYGLVWTDPKRPGKRASNSWPTMVQADIVARKLEREGKTIVERNIRHCGGFAF